MLTDDELRNLSSLDRNYDDVHRTVADMARELLAARRVVKAARRLGNFETGRQPVRDAVEAYDEATREGGCS